VIQFSNLALKVAGRDGRRSITPEAVQQAEEEFSTWKLEHIVAENMYIYPRLNELFERFRGKSRTFSAHAMEAVLADILLDYGEDSKKPDWIRSEWEPADLLKLLYQLEVIGIEKVTTESGGPRQWDFVFARPKGRPEQSASFLFHPGLWKALELI